MYKNSLIVYILEVYILNMWYYFNKIALSRQVTNVNLNIYEYGMNNLFTFVNNMKLFTNLNHDKTDQKFNFS